MLMRIGMACNDEHGNESTLTMVEIGRGMLTLEGDILDGDAIDFCRGRLRVGKYITGPEFRYTSRARYAGNLCWDEVGMGFEDAAKLVNHLRTLPHWSCTTGTSYLFRKWQKGEPFTAADFVEPLS